MALVFDHIHLQNIFIHGCFYSVPQVCPTFCDPKDGSTPGFPVLHHLLALAQTCRLSWWCHPTISPSAVPFSSCLQTFPALGSFLMSWLFPAGGQSIGASASACLLNKCSGLISFRIDWFDLFAVQGTLKSLIQHHSSKASILWCSAYFVVQLSHPYMTTGKIITLTIRTFVGKVMSLLFNTLSRFVITFVHLNIQNT